jgi:hypothetical protein
MTDPAIHLGLLDDADHEARLYADEAPQRRAAAYRETELRIQALGAAISRRDWHAVEQAHAAIRDKFYAFDADALNLKQKPSE